MEIKELRDITGFSQNAFADKFHIPLSTYCHWEQGLRTPPHYVIYMIKTILESDGYDVSGCISNGNSQAVSINKSDDSHAELFPKKPFGLSMLPGNFPRFVKYYQFDVFYERELKLWSDNDDFRGKPLHDYLYENRLKYIGKAADELTDAEILRGLTISGVLKSYTVFDASVMKDVIKDYDIKSVYDPCAGWGERMLCCNAEKISYMGVDINPNLDDGYRRMIDELRLKDCQFVVGDSASISISGDFDAVITCPPYHNVEHYSDIGIENSSYDEFLDWWKQVVMNSKTNCHVRYFCFQINQKYRADMIDIVEDCGFSLIDARTYKTNKSSHFTRKSGVNEKKEFEVMLIFENDGYVSGGE